MSAVQRRGSLLCWLGGHELGLVLSLLVAAGGLWVFAELADEIMERGTVGVDRAILLAMRSEGDLTDPIGPRWFEEMARDVTALGGAAVLTLVTVAAVGYLLLRRQLRSAAFMAIAVTTAQLLSMALKAAFARPRPDIVPHFSYVYTSSFPSGHSMLSAAVLLTVAALLAHAHPDLLVRGYILLLAVVTTIFVGLSRVYLGVHWPTDVAGGWAAGAAWAALAWSVARLVERKRGAAARAGAHGERAREGHIS